MSQVKTNPFLLMFALVCVIAGLVLWPVIGFGQDSPDAPLSATTLDDAARVQRQGRIFVGVSPDDPPFAYPNDDFAIDGFDIAVMKAVAEKMGVEAEFSAIVFPSLLDAVQLGQVDAVISAMAITDGRLEEVDFTNPYFIGTEAFLAAAPAGGAAPALKVDGADDLVGHKVGVQAGTIYAGWVRENLIDTGLAKEEDITVFNTIDQAIRALSKGDVDVLMLDSLDANNFAQKGGFAVVGQGLTRQRYGIALRKGSTLAAPMNDALLQLQTDGTISKLAGQYLAVDSSALQPVPTPTAPPTPTPPPCTYFARFVADLNYDDAHGPPLVKPGQLVNKQWRVLNTGTCAWNGNFRVGFAGGDRLGGQSYAIGRSIAPGEYYDVAVNLTAPAAPGVYRSQWVMVDDQGQVFGQPFWANIAVPGANPIPPPAPIPPAPVPNPVPVPPPGPPPGPAPLAPTINDFHASHHKVAVGLCVKLKWQVSGDVTEVKIKRDGSDWKKGLGMSGSKKDCPSSDGKHTYELKVRGPGGSNSAWEEVKFKYMPLTGDAGEAPGGDE